MSGGGNLLATLAPMALMAIPGVGEALTPALMGMGMEAGAATSALSTGLMGALTSGGISALTGGKNPLQSALIGGLGAGFGSYAMNGLGGAADGAADAASGVSDLAGNTGIQGASAYGSSPLSSVNSQFSSGLEGGSGANALADMPSASSLLGGSGSDMLSNAAAASPATANPSMMSSIGNYIKDNPLKAGLLGLTGISALQSLMPQKPVNVAQNRQDVMNADPGFNSPLPAYHMQNTATPYAGDWYKYGLSPQPAMYSSMAVPGMKHGGTVKGYAAGGGVPMPQPPMGASPQPTGGIPINPLTVKTAFNVGHAIGKSLKQNKMTPPGQVHGKGGGQDDLVPAKLSQGEYVLSADIPAALGDGSTDQGAKILDEFVKNIRAHKTSKGSKFPPKSKNPLTYLPNGAA